MNFTSHLRQKLIELLEEKRIVVWYDAERVFKDFAASFKAPHCTVLSAADSILLARRRADEAYRLMNESENRAEAGRCLLIYIPKARGADERAKTADPFEVYAVAGTAFGEAEDQKFESLARQAMPDQAEEITRLFREGRPTIRLLDSLKKTKGYPLLNQTLRTETPAEVIALFLCDDDKAKAVEETPGCVEELLRLLDSSVGFAPSDQNKEMRQVRDRLASFVLFSEFILDSSDESPDALSAVPKAGEGSKDIIFDACGRMRSNVDLQQRYIEHANRVEQDLHLPELIPMEKEPGSRDTFPFEEKRCLQRLVERAGKGDFEAVRSIAAEREKSIWRRDPKRSLVWAAAERGAALLETAGRVMGGLTRPKTLRSFIEAYTSGGWADLDRRRRRFEAALTAVVDEEELKPLVELCRDEYLSTVSRMQEGFTLCFLNEGSWPPEGVLRQTRVFDDFVAPALERRERTAYLLVDSLRFEMGLDLAEALEQLGRVEVTPAAAVLPTVTEYGMAALMPRADGMLRLVEKDGGYVPALGMRLLKSSSDRMKYLKEIYGDRFFETTLDNLLSSSRRYTARLKEADFLVIRTQDPDAIAENLGGWRARKYLSDVIGDIAAAVKTIVDAGFKRVVIAADHGHILLPEISPGDVVAEPAGKWLMQTRRCRLGTGLSGAAGTMTLKAEQIGVTGDVRDICFALGFKVFTDGEAYFHEGLSLQETIVPVIVLNASALQASFVKTPAIEIRYKSDRFTSRVIGLTVSYRAGLIPIPIKVRIDAYAGGGGDAEIVGEAADCPERDERTREINLEPNKEISVPVLIKPDFDGREVEIRVSDPQTRVVWARLKLRNDVLE